MSNILKKNSRKQGKRRYKIIKPVRFFVFVLVCIMTLVFTVYGIFCTTNVQAANEVKYTEVCIQENDTLWNIAETYNPNANIDIRTILYEIYEVNGISAESIYPGDIIKVPIYN